MARGFDVRVPSAVDATALRTQLLDVHALRAAALAGGALESEATVDGGTTTIRRTLPVPDVARLLVKTPRLIIVEQRTWHDLAAEVDMRFEGLHISVRGRLELIDAGAQPCTVHASGTIEANMGFTGQFVEAFMRDHIVDAIQAEIAALS